MLVIIGDHVYIQGSFICSSEAILCRGVTVSSLVPRMAVVAGRTGGGAGGGGGPAEVWVGTT